MANREFKQEIDRVNAGSPYSLTLTNDGPSSELDICGFKLSFSQEFNAQVNKTGYKKERWNIQYRIKKDFIGSKWVRILANDPNYVYREGDFVLEADENDHYEENDLSQSMVVLPLHNGTITTTKYNFFEKNANGNHEDNGHEWYRREGPGIGVRYFKRPFPNPTVGIFHFTLSFKGQEVLNVNLEVTENNWENRTARARVSVEVKLATFIERGLDPHLLGGCHGILRLNGYFNSDGFINRWVPTGEIQRDFAKLFTLGFESDYGVTIKKSGTNIESCGNYEFDTHDNRAVTIANICFPPKDSYNGIKTGWLKPQLDNVYDEKQPKSNGDYWLNPFHIGVFDWETGIDRSRLPSYDKPNELKLDYPYVSNWWNNTTSEYGTYENNKKAYGNTFTGTSSSSKLPIIDINARKLDGVKLKFGTPKGRFNFSHVGSYNDQYVFGTERVVYTNRESRCGHIFPHIKASSTVVHLSFGEVKVSDFIIPENTALSGRYRTVFNGSQIAYGNRSRLSLHSGDSYMDLCVLGRLEVNNCIIFIELDAFDVDYDSEGWDKMLTLFSVVGNHNVFVVNIKRPISMSIRRKDNWFNDGQNFVSLFYDAVHNINNAQSDNYYIIKHPHVAIHSLQPFHCRIPVYSHHDYERWSRTERNRFRAAILRDFGYPNDHDRLTDSDGFKYGFEHHVLRQDRTTGRWSKNLSGDLYYFDLLDKLRTINTDKYPLNRDNETIKGFNMNKTVISSGSPNRLDSIPLSHKQINYCLFDFYRFGLSGDLSRCVEGFEYPRYHEPKPLTDSAGYTRVWFRPNKNNSPERGSSLTRLKEVWSDVYMDNPQNHFNRELYNQPQNMNMWRESIVPYNTSFSETQAALQSGVWHELNLNKQELHSYTFNIDPYLWINMNTFCHGGGHFERRTDGGEYIDLMRQPAVLKLKSQSNVIHIFLYGDVNFYGYDNGGLLTPSLITLEGDNNHVYIHLKAHVILSASRNKFTTTSGYFFDNLNSFDPARFTLLSLAKVYGNNNRITLLVNDRYFHMTVGIKDRRSKEMTMGKEAKPQNTLFNRTINFDDRFSIPNYPLGTGNRLLDNRPLSQYQYGSTCCGLLSNSATNSMYIVTTHPDEFKRSDNTYARYGKNESAVKQTKGFFCDEFHPCFSFANSADKPFGSSPFFLTFEQIYYYTGFYWSRTFVPPYHPYMTVHF